MGGCQLHACKKQHNVAVRSCTFLNATPIPNEKPHAKPARCVRHRLIKVMIAPGPGSITRLARVRLHPPALGENLDSALRPGPNSQPAQWALERLVSGQPSELSSKPRGGRVQRGKCRPFSFQASAQVSARGLWLSVFP